ncbi:cysteine proteinase [Aspergillus sclerotioniger CBS 115572]|uniref:Cysteine proteinase n=1 Tax=Aspergillus sclerotioniger CBS 115572 TaxID=1450535 RepID=A0A317WUG2_9EURO|nr:cysteine proteinase [Aspergillus sclerotioniger CBS 115572]PWY88827.1 cysteine proteinase [Aspergillus sclerotioniger CBS 115572]
MTTSPHPRGATSPSTTQVSAYTPAQITTWLHHLHLPRAYTPYITNPSTFPQTFESLRTLMRCQISRFPFENLSVHYSSTHVVDIRPAILYNKLLGPNANGRGGYCLELSILFHHMLCGLGFKTYMTGARIRARVDGVPGGGLFGDVILINHLRIHTTNIIHLPNGTKYSIDVGFGGDAPSISTISSISSANQLSIFSNLGPQQIRLSQSHIPLQSPFLTHSPESQNNKFWIYRYRNRPTHEWNSFYCFQEIEFFEADFEVVNLFACLRSPVHRGSVLVVRFLRGDVNIIGKVMLVDKLIKVNLGGKTRVVHEFTTEEGRMQALWKYFGIRLTEEEKEGIRGWDKELL